MQNTFFASGEPPYVRTVWERRFALICLRPSLPTARSRASNRYIEKEADPLKQNTICYVAEVDSQVVGVSLVAWRVAFRGCVDGVFGDLERLPIYAKRKVISYQ